MPVCGLILAFAIAGTRERVFGNGDPPLIRSLAVLPFQNLSDEPGQDYFADAMTEELITQLSGISMLKVISRTSVMRYKNTNKSLSGYSARPACGRNRRGFGVTLRR